MEYNIIQCRKEDIPAVIILCAHHADFEKAEYDKNGKKDALRKAIFGKNPVLHCWVVVVNEKVMGYVTFTFNYSTWNAGYFLYLDCLYLEPEIRSMGIGAEIIKRLKAIARKNECVNIQWQTPEFNIRAIQFYNRVGGKGKKKVRFFIDPEQFGEDQGPLLSE